MNEAVFFYIKLDVEMLGKLKELFSGNSKELEKQYLEENGIQYDAELGYVIDGIIINELSERLEYFSNRRMNRFDDLKALYLNAILINEKIDLEIANKRFVARLGNSEENLLQLKLIIKKLNDYYRQFLRDKK